MARGPGGLTPQYDLRQLEYFEAATSGGGTAMAEVDMRKLALSRRWKHRRASKPKASPMPIADRAHAPADETRRQSIRDRLVDWRDSCWRCRRPIVVGQIWTVVSNGEVAARFSHRDCQGEWLAQQETAARLALGLDHRSAVRCGTAGIEIPLQPEKRNDRYGHGRLELRSQCAAGGQSCGAASSTYSNSREAILAVCHQARFESVNETNPFGRSDARSIHRNARGSSGRSPGSKTRRSERKSSKWSQRLRKPICRLWRTASASASPKKKPRVSRRSAREVESLGGAVQCGGRGDACRAATGGARGGWRRARRAPRPRRTQQQDDADRIGAAGARRRARPPVA